MALVTGRNLTLYTGDQMNVIGCEESCTLTITNEEIITTSKGSGRFTNREYGTADWSVQSNGVIFMYADEPTAASDSKTDPLYLTAYALEGKKVCVKLQFTDGTTTKYLIGNGIITNIVNTGSAEGYATFDVTIAADGRLYQSSNLQSATSYDGPSIIVYTATGSTASFTDSRLIDATKVYFITKNGVPFNTITTLADAVSFPLANVGVYLPAGYVAFPVGTPLVANDVIVISYDPA